MKNLFFAFTLLYTSFCCAQEKIYLTSGDSLLGKTAYIDTDHIRVTKTDGKSLVLLVSMIKSIEKDSKKLYLTPDGFKDFVVIDCKGQSAKDLYLNSIKYINRMYKNPNKVIKAQIDNEYLKFETYVEKISKVESVMSLNISCLYTVELSFKDNKFKYQIISMEMKINQNNPSPYYLVGSPMMGLPVYNKKLELIRPEVKEDFENYFNDEVINIRNFLTSANNLNDW